MVRLHIVCAGYELAVREKGAGREGKGLYTHLKSAFRFSLLVITLWLHRCVLGQGM